MASIDMCEHDWPGSGCRECFPKKPKFIEYSIPMDFENLPPAMVLGHEGKYYSFGRTWRTAQSVWDEVKDKLDTLVQCEFTAEEIADLVQFKVEN
jgi:hypothetical protein